MSYLKFQNSAFPILSDGPLESDDPHTYKVLSKSISIDHPYGTADFYRHGWHSWSPTAFVTLKNPPVPVEPAARRQQCDDGRYALSRHHSGSALGAIRNQDHKCLFVGALGLDGRVEGTPSRLFAFYEDAPAEWFITFGSYEDCLARYAKELAKGTGVRSVATPSRVWCSWYSYFQKINETDLYQTLCTMKDFPFDVFQIDDGWQCDIGDWQANNKFAQGMQKFAEKIARQGLRPGIWLAPFLVRPSSQLFREHRDWLLKDDFGEPVIAGFNWGDHTYALDTTHPEVIDWLSELFTRVTQWGYSYLKLDFLYAGALPGKRYTAMARELAYRTALQHIRNCVGDGCYLLACGSPIVASLGIVDGMRIGPDVAPYWDREERSVLMHDHSWPSTRNALRTCLHRLWISHFCEVDPDVVFARSKHNLLTEEQKNLLFALAEITGFKASSCPPNWLDEHEKKRLKEFLATQAETKALSLFCYLVNGKTVDFTPWL